MKMFLLKIIFFYSLLFGNNCLNQFKGIGLEQLTEEEWSFSSNLTQEKSSSFLPTFIGDKDGNRSIASNATTTQLSIDYSTEVSTKIYSQSIDLISEALSDTTSGNISVLTQLTVTQSGAPTPMQKGTTPIGTSYSSLGTIPIGITQPGPILTPTQSGAPATLPSVGKLAGFMLTRATPIEDNYSSPGTTQPVPISFTTLTPEAISRVTVPTITTITSEATLQTEYMGNTPTEGTLLKVTQTGTTRQEIIERNHILKTTSKGNKSESTTNKSLTTPLIILDVIAVNTTFLNETKTLEDMFEEENRSLNTTDSVLNTTESGEQLNSSLVTTILSAGPGIPIFLKPPKFLIHDPDEGPIDPFVHPSNDSDEWDAYPSTETPNQQFVLMNKPEFEPEKGSLEEKYKHLLIDSDDNIPLPSDEEIIPKIRNDWKTTTTTTTTTVSPNVWQSNGQPYGQPFIPYPYYGYNPYLGYQQYWPSYGNGYNYPNYRPQDYPEYQFSTMKTLGIENHGNQDEFEKVGESEQEPTDEKKVKLPKSYQKFGAYITQITLDDKQNKDVITGDKDTLEILGPIEWMTTTTAVPISTLPNEIRFIINQQNINQMNRSHKRKKPMDMKRKKTNDERQRHVFSDYRHPSDPWNWRTTVRPIGRLVEPIPRRVVYRTRKLPQNRRRRIKIHRFVKISNKTDDLDQFSTTNEKYVIGGEERMPSIGRRVHKTSVKQKVRKHDSIGKIAPNVEIVVKNADIKVKQSKQGGFQRRLISDHDTKPDWKTTIKPKFLVVAKIRDLAQLKVDTLTGIKWWYQEQPNYCSEPIYVLSDCSNGQLSKRWSYNPENKRCYLYEDLCSKFKANSFETSQECFRKCYRLKESNSTSKL